MRHREAGCLGARNLRIGRGRTSRRASTPYQARLRGSELLEQRCLLTAISWTGDGDGTSWTDTHNWSPMQIPSFGDDVTIDVAGNPTVTITGDESINSLQVSDTLKIASGSLIVSAPSQINVGGTLTLAGGFLEFYSTTFTNSGAISISNGTDIDGGTLDNKGTITHSAGTLNLNAVLENEGTYDFTGDGAINLNEGGQGTFTNASSGLFEKTAGTGTSSIGGGVLFDNQGGKVAGDAGTLTLGAGTSTGGTYNAMPGDIVDLVGSEEATFSGTYSGSGGGTVRLATGVMDIGAAGATLNFPASMFQITGGSLNLAGNTLTNKNTITVSAVATELTSESGVPTNAVFDNQGTVIEPSGDWTIASTLTFKNEGTYNFTGDGTVADEIGLPTFINTGLLEKTGGTGHSAVGFDSLAFENQGGTIQVNTGTLSFAGGTSTGGVFNVEAGAVLQLGDETGLPVFAGTYTGSGGGAIQVGMVPGIGIGAGGATFNFPPGLLQLNEGTLNLQGNTLTNAGSISIVGVANLVSQVGGNSNLGGTLDNKGTIVHSAGDFVGSIALKIQDSATLENEGTYKFLSDDLMVASFESTGTFINTATGLFEKTAGSGSSGVGFGLAFDNQGGTVEADAGTLTLGAGTSTGGTYTALLGATIDLVGGQSATFSGTYSGSGAGMIILATGSINIGASGATFNFLGNSFQFEGGTIDLAGNTLVNLGVINISGQSPTLDSSIGATTNLGGTLDNKGTMVEAATTSGFMLSDGVTLKNESTFDFTGDGSIAFGQDNASTILNTVTGLMAKIGGVGTSAMSAGLLLNNLGTVRVNTGTLSFAGTVMQVSGGTLTGGSWIASGTGTLMLPSGNFDTNDGSVTLSGSGLFPQIDALSSNNGSFSLLGGRSFTTIASFDNAGSLTLGAGSTMTVSAGQILLSSSTVTIDIGGTPASGLYGQLNVTNFDTLNGTLNIVLTNGFFPTAGQTFQIMSYGAVNLGFAAINGLTSSGNTIFSAAENPTTFVLTGVHIPAPRVSDVLVDGTTWAPGFLKRPGNGRARQRCWLHDTCWFNRELKPLPWTNLNQIQIVFNENVNVQQSSLVLTGMNVANYAFSTFSYNAATFTATWTLVSPIGDDKLSIDLHASGPADVTNGQATALDGEWTNATSVYPSGNGSAGGDFNFAFNVLPGDVNQDGIINVQDLALVSSGWLSAGPAGDVNADGIVNSQDLAFLSSNWLATLPAGGAQASASVTGADSAAQVATTSSTGQSVPVLDTASHSVGASLPVATMVAGQVRLRTRS